MFIERRGAFLPGVKKGPPSGVGPHWVKIGSLGWKRPPGRKRVKKYLKGCGKEGPPAGFPIYTRVSKIKRIRPRYFFLCFGFDCVIGIALRKFTEHYFL